MGLELVERIPTLAEAQIAAGALRSGGIDAEVFDANFGQIEAPVIESLGGFRLMAPAAQTALAREMLRTLRAGPPLAAGEDAASPWSAPAAPSPRSRRVRRVWAWMFMAAGAAWIVQALVRGS